ncbi:MAG: hypothetical protein E7Z92_06275 [Cyanobacteria bacterium SIG31]|nr:hypothetical protein [Cyanobacteria bacterium SIG31]
MKKLALLLLLCVFVLCGCKYDRGIILFNSQPITRENALHDSKSFNSGQRVYYLFIAPKKMDNNYIRVQIFKMTDKAPWGGNEVVRTKDFRLMKDERYYHSDYFTLYEKGRYVMQVFSINDFQHPLSVGDFYVR